MSDNDALAALIGGSNITTDAKKGGDHSIDSLFIDMKDIIEDPDQPRKTFDDVAIKELSTDIAKIGVKTPISVRVIEGKKNKYIINHGARRFRASTLAGLKKIPAIIDNTYTPYDQVKENIDREDLSPYDLAVSVWIQNRKEQHKEAVTDIAKGLNRSRAYVHQLLALLTMPPCVQAVYDANLAPSVQAVYGLSQAYKTYPEKVERFCNSSIHNETVLSKKGVNDFVKSLKPDNTDVQQDQGEPVKAAEAVKTPQVNNIETLQEESKSVQNDSQNPKDSITVNYGFDPVYSYKGEQVTLDLTQAPDKMGCVYVRVGSGDLVAVKCSDVQFSGIQKRMSV